MTDATALLVEATPADASPKSQSASINQATSQDTSSVSGESASSIDPAPQDSTTWIGGLSDADKKFIEERGFKSAGDALAALRGFSPPESADKYDLPVPQGEDSAFAKSMAPLLHKAGISATQAKALTEGWNTHVAQQRETQRQAEAASQKEASALAERQEAELRREWGTAFDANAEHGRRALAQGAQAAGIGADQMSSVVQALEGKIGFSATVKLFSFFGKHFAEDAAHVFGNSSSGQAPNIVAAARLFDKSNMNP